MITPSGSQPQQPNPYQGMPVPNYPPPGQFPIPQQRRNHRKWPWILLAVVLLGFAGCTAAVVSVSNSVNKAENSPGAVQKPTAASGTAVRDGKFQFHITAVDPPVTTAGTDPIMQKTAQGEYLIVHVEVSNIAKVPQSYFDENQKLIDNHGKEYGNDSGADIALNQNLTADINPGNRIAVAVAFDVPQGTTATAIEFHDSAFSNGARVAVP